MVKILTALFLALLCAQLCSALAQNVPDLRIGDTARDDIATPVELTVVDQEKTEALRQVEARRVLAIFRFSPNVASEVEHNFNAALDELRGRFLEAAKSKFNSAT